MKTFWYVTGLVAMADGATKWHASQFSPNVVFNLGQTRFGMPLHTQVVVSLLVVFVILAIQLRERYRVPGLDYMTGMMMGGALGNAVSLLTGPDGVLDFIPIGIIVFNIADVFLWVGAVGMVYVVAMAALRARV